MRRTIPAVFILGTLVLFGGPRAGTADDKPDPKAEQAMKASLSKLQGLWQFESQEEDGKPVAPRRLQRRTIFFGGNSIMIREGGEVLQAGQLTLDPETPGAIDLKILAGPFRNITMLGIYEQKGNTLRVCYDTAGRERPKEFKTSADSGLMVAVYKREKGADEPDVSGTYDCDGVEMDGNRYTAKVEIQRVGEAYTVTWAKGPGLMAIGVGLRKGNVFSVSFANKGMAGIAVYEITKPGKLEGQWTEVGGIGMVRAETLTLKK